jgi:hypothetical protein
MKALFLTVVAMAAVVACEPYYGRLPEFASSELSCEQSEVTVSDALSTNAAVRYTARCGDGRSYRCITMMKRYGEAPETICRPSAEGEVAENDDEMSAGASPSVETHQATRGVLPGGWPRIRIAACGAEATMPSDAKVVETVEATTQLTMHEARGHAGGSAFNLACTQIPALATTPSKANEIVAGAAQGALDAVDGELIASRKLSVGTGRSLLIRVQGAQMAIRVWTQGPWLYSASVAPIDKLPDGAVAEYLDRITVPATGR